MSQKQPPRMFKPWVYTEVPRFLLIGAAVGIVYQVIKHLI
jgi:hypothetical protein